MMVKGVERHNAMFLKGGTRSHATSLPRTNATFYFIRNLLVARSHLLFFSEFSSLGLKHTHTHTHTNTPGRVFKIHIHPSCLALLGSTTRVNNTKLAQNIYIYIQLAQKILQPNLAICQGKNNSLGFQIKAHCPDSWDRSIFC